MAHVQIATNYDRLSFVELGDMSIKCYVPLQALVESLQSLSGVHDVSGDQEELLVLGSDEAFGVCEFGVRQIIRDVDGLHFRVNGNSVVALAYVPVRVVALQ